MALIEKLHETADVIRFRAHSSACARRRQIKQAMPLLHKICEIGLAGNTISPHHMLGGWQHRHVCTCSQLQ